MRISSASRSRRRPRGQEFRQSPVEAYREGLAGDWKPPSAFIAQCVSIATSLQAATMIRSQDDREAAVALVAERAHPLLPPETVRAGGRHDPRGKPTPAAVLRALVLAMESEEGHGPLGVHILDSLRILYPLDSPDGARILFALGHSCTTTGADELLLERSITLLGIARRRRDSELLSRAWAGIRGHALHRGNLPRAARAARRSLKHAERANDPRALSVALLQQGVIHGMRGEYSESTRFMWDGYRLSDHGDLRAIILNNLGETLYRSGQFQAARAARAEMLATYHEVGMTLVALGGYAECCSCLGDVAGTEWASRQVIAMSGNRRQLRQMTQAYLGCARACGRVGLRTLAETMHQRGIALAERHGYHDLRFAPSPAGRSETPETQQFHGEAESARRSIIELAPDGVRPELVLVTR